VVLEVVEDGDVLVARELGALLAEELVEPQVLGRHVVVGLAVENGRRITPLWVWKLTPAQMLGCLR
jgi:hypothetical protein